MKQKVWVIDDPSWQDSSEQTPREVSHSEMPKAGSRPSATSSKKSPAWSFSLSMILWGSGQIYIGAYGPGTIFLALMIFFYGALSMGLFFKGAAVRFISDIGIPAPVIVAGAVIYLFAGLVCWLTSAVDAYYRTTGMRSERFRGVDQDLWPLLGSLVFPGWGQFLNGQSKKGLFFLSCGGLGIFSGIFLFLAPYTWPVFSKGSLGFVLEIFLVGALLMIPLSLLLWIVSAYDAFISCQELFLEKLRRNPTTDFGRKRVTAKRLMPRLSAILALLLAISVGHQLVPKGYYRNSLERILSEATKRDMELIPGLVGQALEILDR
jgi:hypothetical protein